MTAFTKEQLIEKVHASELYYKACIKEYIYAKDELHWIESNCDDAEETMNVYKQMLADWDEG